MSDERARAQRFIHEYTREHWPYSHPDDYDPTDDQLVDLVLAFAPPAPSGDPVERILAVECPDHCAGEGVACGGYQVLKNEWFCAARIRAALVKP